MKKLWNSPEVFAAVLTVIGTLLVSIVLGFMEGRIGFGSVLALFALIVVALLIYALYRRGGARMAVGGGIAMLLIGFLVFFVVWFARGRRAAPEPMETPGSQLATSVGANATTEAASEPTPTAAQPKATQSPADVTAAPTPSPGARPIIGVWEPAPTLPQQLISLAACPTQAEGETPVLYAGATGFIYRSDDAGASWTPISQGLPNLDVIAMACVPGAPDRLYAALAHGNPLLLSEDGGVTWQHQADMEFALGGFWFQLLPAPSDPETLYYLSKAGFLMLSPNAGKTWIPAQNGLPQSEHGDVSILSLAIHPTDPNTLYAGTGGFVGGGHGVYTSADGGQNWRAANNGMLDLRITALAIDPASPQTIYAGSDAGDLLKTTDGGASWSRLDPIPAVPRYSEPREIREIVVDRFDPAYVIVLGDNSGPLASRDGGQTWQMLGKPTGHDQPYFDLAHIVSPRPQLVIVADFQNYEPQRYAQTP